MDTGPREGDLYFENDFEKGTPDWYSIERNNAIYRQRHSRKNKDIPDNVGGFPSWPIYALLLMNSGKSLDSTLRQFIIKNKI